MKFLLVMGTAITVIAVFLACRDMAKKSRNAESNIRWTLLFGLAVISGMWWVGLAELGERSESEVKVNPSIFSTYPRASYDRTYTLWGSSGVDEIMRVEKLAAVKAARQRACDNVYYIGLSEKHSTPGGRIVVFADCDSGWRYYIDHDLNIIESKKIN